jgi:hypothetical protein
MGVMKRLATRQMLDGGQDMRDPATTESQAEIDVGACERCGWDKFRMKFKYNDRHCRIDAHCARCGATREVSLNEAHATVQRARSRRDRKRGAEGKGRQCHRRRHTVRKEGARKTAALTILWATWLFHFTRCKDE